MNRLRNSIQSIKGIGPKKAALFSKLGVETIEDALNFFPREYEKRGSVQSVDSIQEGMVFLCLQWKGCPRINRMKRGFSTTIWKGTDETGEIDCVWFNQPYRANLYKSNKKYYVSGKVVKKSKGYQVQNPIVEEYDEVYHNQTRHLPIYPLTKGLTLRDVRQVIQQALKMLPKGTYFDEMDRYISSRYNMISKGTAWRCIHFPENAEAVMHARKRLAFEELLELQVALQYIKSCIQDKRKGLIIPASREQLHFFLQNLPYQLTQAQNKVLDEVLSDLSSGKVMNRLIQGDVGSGKTVISAAALYCTVQAGYQAVMMVPTEILARQHVKSLTKYLCTSGGKRSICIELLTGSIKDTEKEKVKQELLKGKVQILIGTHAVIQEDVKFQNLGLVITDEQHRFGVRQKALLHNKGIVPNMSDIPHMLVMSATPIPRTLAHILHGDLDLSVIDTLPPGRVPIQTFLVNSKYRQRVYRFVQKHAMLGNQAYIVCPLVEDSENGELRSAEQVYQELSKGPLKEIKTGLLHGRQKTKEKEKIMEAFAKGQIHALISTTVIEVGIHVPNAVIMIIENAERFGLAQLHQLRGRVGRGDKPSYCILISDQKDKIGLARMQVLVQSNDGFEIAEKDLELRGPGELYGLRQHGMLQFQIANPIRDHALFELAHQAAIAIVQNAQEEQNQKIVHIALDKQSRLPIDTPAN
jgi:ATP-dependent DNA helicase RecG